MKKRAKKIHINGIVQGVGFRPFIYQLARRYRLTGYVGNTSQGVDIEVEGTEQDLAAFFQAIDEEKPPLARIVTSQHQDQPPQNHQEFVIRASSIQKNRSVLISPDMAVCRNCLAELFDPNDRRYRYPFINCTNCGPRYTIIHDVPYDRPYTAMAKFVMCQQCSREYHDPGDRRFHAQPNACWQCGPRLWLVDRNGQTVSCPDPVAAAVDLLRQGYILGIKGLGGFHLAANAENQKAVLTLRQRKHRQQKPLAIMASDLEAIARYAHLDSQGQELLQAPFAPIVLLPRRKNSGIAPAVSLENDHYGVMLPYTPVHHLLIRDNFRALVMTSGNISEEPIVIANDQAVKRLGTLADYLLLHDRDIYLRCDDSVQKFIAGRPALLRRGRGYAPAPIMLDAKLPAILGCGAELKNTVCLLRQDQAIVSQHIGDMENLDTYRFFEQTIDHLQKLLQTRLQALAYDLHPGYLATRYALEQRELPAIGVQHHYAHIVSVMAEWQLQGEVIGIALDGTGYGNDGHIWGGEILRASRQDFQRIAHLEYTPLPGGDAAVRYPWRMALSYLYHAYGQSLFSMATNFCQRFAAAEVTLVIQMLEQKVNTPLTSSCGRLFDGVSSLLAIRDKASYEGQAAIALEICAGRIKHQDYYPMTIKQGSDPATIEVKSLIRQIIADIHEGRSREYIAHKFHNSLVEVFCCYCLEIRNQQGLNRVVLSGGVWQNKLLTEKMIERLGDHGFSVFTNAQVPTNDGGLALGQAVIAAYRFIKNRS